MSGGGRGLAAHLAGFARALRAAGVRVSLGDEVDAADALTRVDLLDREEVRRALAIALKIRPRDREVFEHTFDSYWTNRAPAPLTFARPSEGRGPPVAGAARTVSARALGTDAGASAEPPVEGGIPGYSPHALLRKKPFDQLSAGEVAAMDRLLARLAPRLATERSRRLVPTRGRGLVDLRRSLRRVVPTLGELLSPSRRARALEQPRLTLLCDTSGSMEPHARFVLSFVIALKRVVRRVEVFAFNTSLTRLTPWLVPGKIPLTLERIVAGVPDWSGGTRIGACLADFVARHLEACVTSRTVVVVVSDGLDRGDTDALVRSMRAIRRRARRVVWLNPLLGDPRYEPTARGMEAALPFVDRLASAHNLESLERLVTLVAA